MSDTSPRLELPYLHPSQAQKHVTHNEALQRLDALVQPAVLAIGGDTPPVSPAPGDLHIPGAAAIGAWAGQADHLAQWDGTAWMFFPPQDGWRVHDLETGQGYVFQGGGWQVDLPGLDNLEQVGIGTAADTQNRLAVAAAASLFTHAGSDHRVKVNKAAPADTASLLFQSDWAGHAEIGLAGDIVLAFKVSADGSAWHDAMRLDPVAQEIAFAPASGVRARLSDTALTLDVPVTGAAVQGTPQDVTPGRLMRADFGYGPGNLLGAVSQNGSGLPTGAVIEQGSNANGAYVRWADGTQICTRVFDHLLSMSAAGNVYTENLAAWPFPANFISGSVPSFHCNMRACWGGTDNVTNGYAIPKVYSHDDKSGSTRKTHLLAIGRWF
jgi:hypothetical protein